MNSTLRELIWKYIRREHYKSHSLIEPYSKQTLNCVITLTRKLFHSERRWQQLKKRKMTSWLKLKEGSIKMLLRLLRQRKLRRSYNYKNGGKRRRLGQSLRLIRSWNISTAWRTQRLSPVISINLGLALSTLRRTQANHQQKKWWWECLKESTDLNEASTKKKKNSKEVKRPSLKFNQMWIRFLMLREIILLLLWNRRILTRRVQFNKRANNITAYPNKVPRRETRWQQTRCPFSSKNKVISNKWNKNVFSRPKSITSSRRKTLTSTVSSELRSHSSRQHKNQTPNLTSTRSSSQPSASPIAVSRYPRWPTDNTSTHHQ